MQLYLQVPSMATPNLLVLPNSPTRPTGPMYGAPIPPAAPPAWAGQQYPPGWIPRPDPYGMPMSEHPYGAPAWNYPPPHNPGPQAPMQNAMPPGPLVGQPLLSCLPN